MGFFSEVPWVPASLSWACVHLGGRSCVLLRFLDCLCVLCFCGAPVFAFVLLLFAVCLVVFWGVALEVSWGFLVL